MGRRNGDQGSRPDLGRPNVAFVKSLGCYDEVVTYDRVTSLPPDAPVAYIDMAGNSALRENLHRHFGAQMKYSGRIGLTHRSTAPDEGELPGAKPTWFFAPDQIRKRAKEWGPGGVDTALLARRGPPLRRSSTAGSR